MEKEKKEDETQEENKIINSRVALYGQPSLKLIRYCKLKTKIEIEIAEKFFTIFLHFRTIFYFASQLKN
ncbi:MAG: hypothetical protein RMJ81_06835 [Candidatus Kryptonium sp.]|nr:hypothetical protein [Candidatus Kryptonium sp.]